MSPALCLLHLRRGLRPWLLVAVAALAVLVLAGDAPRSFPGADATPAALRRRELWTALLLLLLPAALLSAARIPTRWRTDELDWIAPRAAGLGRALVACWTGRTAAVLVGACAVAALAESTPGAGAEFTDRGWLVGELVAGAEADARSWIVAPGATAEGARLEVPLRAWAWSGPAVDALLRVERGGATRSWSGRLGRAREVVVALPAGTGPATLTLERRSEGAALHVERVGARLLVPASGGAGSRGVLARVGLAAALALALAVGFGAWVSAPTAALAAALPWLVAWLADAPLPLPGDDLPAALDGIARGRAAALPDLSRVAFATAGSAFALALGRAGIAARRRES